MQPSRFNHSAKRFLLLAVFTLFSGGFYSAATANAQPNISIKGNFTPAKVGRGRTAQATVVMEIPRGFHVHSNKPLERFLIATQLQVEAPNGLRVGPVTYPRALLRNLKFSRNRVAVYEGRVTMRFSVMVPRNFATGTAEIKAKVRYQSCDDEVCFPPQTKEEKLWLKIE
ncbi:MAG: protein-disulfide reductase DsbD N-terminal domain-containing protein [Pyrinomonadaceae bacterium]|nr:protein-disulfide reductase DsbD N-terminal domain-containing protein [Pyrinomonadaceae bacterium]